MVTPAVAVDLRRGQSIALDIEGIAGTGTIEGVVSARAAACSPEQTVGNGDGRFPAGGSATLLLPGAMQTVRLVPRAALVREGDLTGVQVVRDGVSERRWVRLGRTHGELVEVLSGLDAGALVAVPDSAGGGT